MKKQAPIFWRAWSQCRRIPPMSRIILDLDRGDVSVNDFTEAFNLQVRLVQEIMRDMGVPTNEVRWVVADLRFGSAYAAATPQMVGPHVFMADIELAMNRAGAGLRSLNEGSARPAHFNDEALKVSRKLTELVTQSSTARTPITFGEVAVRPSMRLVANVSTLIRGELRSIGSIEGQLIGVAGADGSYKIVIRDRLRGRKVPCVIGEAMLQSALVNFERRVVVRGLITSRADGTPVRIEVRALEAMPADDALPSIADMRGVLSNFRVADGE